jgi:hypothetical protein
MKLFIIQSSHTPVSSSNSCFQIFFSIKWIHHADILFPQKLVLTSPTSSGRSVGIVSSRTQVTEFSFFFFLLYQVNVCSSLGRQTESTPWKTVSNVTLMYNESLLLWIGGGKRDILNWTSITFRIYWFLTYYWIQFLFSSVVLNYSPPQVWKIYRLGLWTYWGYTLYSGDKIWTYVQFYLRL